MSHHVIAGSGPIGSAVARELLRRGDQVTAVTRSGSGPDGTTRLAADLGAPDGGERLARIADGAAAIHNCVNPPYHRWPTDWPPIASALLTAAEKTGAVLAVTGNLYGYGEVDGPMTERTPLRATGEKGRTRNAMTAAALQAHADGRVRSFEVRGSDYLGGSSILSLMVLPAWRQGKRAVLPAPTHVPHTFTDVRMMAQLLVTGVEDDRAHGRVWHAPSAPAVPMATVLDAARRQLGVTGRTLVLPGPAMWVAGLFDPFVKGLRETRHQFTRPFVLDSSDAERTFGLTAPSIEESVAFDIAQNWQA